MDVNAIANILIKKLLEKNFIVHRYNSYTTSSIYIKLDYGVSCGIRIADHPGKKKYHYRFNVIKDYVGNEVINRDNLVSYFFDYTELDKVVNAIQTEKQLKINKYGIDKYKHYMKIQKNNNVLFQRFKEIT